MNTPFPPLLVTQAEFDKAASVFTSAYGLDCRPAPADESALAARVRETGCRAVVLGVTPYRRELYDALADQANGQGALLVRFGFGTDSIDKGYAVAKGLTLVNTPVDIQTSVAELTLFLVGAVMRRIARLDATIRGGGFTAVGGRSRDHPPAADPRDARADRLRASGTHEARQCACQCRARRHSG